MFVPCPHCGFLVALIVSKTGAPQRCPRCHKPMQATDAAERDDAADYAVAADDVSLTPPQTAEPAATDVDGTAIKTPPGVDDPKPTPAAPAQRRKPRKRSAGQGRGKSGAPSFARRSVSMIELGPRWPGIVAVVALTVVLAVQLLLAQRAELAASARWRPMIANVCTLLRCDLPPWREPGAFTMLDRQVRPSDGALLVQASFRNDARWPQPWPRLLLRLSDRNGQAVAQRVFQPDEYRGNGDGDGDAPALLAPGQSASIRFAVREPAPDIVAFNFDFR